MFSGDNVSSEEYQDVNRLSWLGALTSDSASPASAFLEQQHVSDVDELIRPTPNFFDDVVTHPSSAAPTACIIPERMSSGEQSGAVNDDPMVISSRPSSKSRHYDDEDYKCHRHLMYPRVHQPLKAMEPRTLRRFSERLMALRAALRKTDNLESNTSGVARTHDTLSTDATSGVDLTWRFTGQPGHENLSALSCTVEPSSENRVLDPSSPSLAERACAVGQAMKSRQFTDNPWSVAQPSCDDLTTKDISTDNTVFFIGGVSEHKRQDSDVIHPSTGPNRVTELHFEDQLLLAKNQGIKYRRKRRSHSKPLPSAFQPSLTKLSEEGSSLSSSTASSCLSLQSSEFVIPKGHTANEMESEEDLTSVPQNGTVEYGVNLSNVTSVRIPIDAYGSAGSSDSLHSQSNSGVSYETPAANCMNVDSLSESTVYETNAHPELVELEEISLNVCTVDKTHVHQKYELQQNQWSSDHRDPKLVEVNPPTGISNLPDRTIPLCPLVNITDATLTRINQSPLHLVDGDSMTFDPFLAPLARPESVTTCNGEEEFVADDGDQGKSETGIRVASANVTAREPGPNRLTVHRSSQLIARTLSGTELKQLNLWRRNKQSRTSRLLSTANESTKAGEVSTFVDKDSVEVESHRYFKLPGTRRRRRLLWAGFRASQRRWESLEQAATLAQRNARLRQCTTSSGPLTASGLSIVEQMTNKSQPKSSPRASVSSINRQDDFRRRYGSVSLPELIDSVDMSRSVSVPYGPSETVLEPPLVARHLLRPDGSVLDHVPPVFAELDILNCERVLGHRGVSAEDSTIGDEQCSRKTFSISTTPIPSASPRGPEVEHKAYSAATDQMNCSWLEAARWVRYEQDIDPVTGTFGQAHSPPLTFQAVVECRRYLEQGAIVLQSDHPDKLLNLINSRSRPCHDPSCLFSEVDTITHALVADCEATTNEIALIRHVLMLRHKHACDLLRVPQHHSLFPHLTGQLPGTLNHPDHTDQLTGLTSFLPNFLTRPRPKTDVRHTTISCDLQNIATQHANHKRTISVPLMDHRLSDMESGTQRASPHPSVASRNLSGTLARRAISAIRRAFTPTTPVCDLSTGVDLSAPSVPESILWRGRSNAGADSSHHVRISEPGYVLHQAPHEVTVKPLSDLAGRLKLTTEIVSVQVGILPGLRRPMLAFIRLQRALFAYGLTELRDSHPVRFLILFFGPERRHLDYSEVGRVIATMMVDKAFRRTAYTAVSREDLMDGLRTFLDTTIVLPMLSDITPKSLLAMNDQLRLFRRHQLNAMRETKNATTVPHPAFRPPSLALFGAHKRSYSRGDSKLNHGAMDPSIATFQTSVPEVVITPPPMYESAAAARVKREMRRPFDHIKTVNRESSAPLLQTSSMLDFRSAEDRMNRYTPASSSGISHNSARNQRRKPSHRQRSSSTRSTPAGLFIDRSADTMGRAQNPRSRPQNYHCFACCCCCCRRHPRRFIVSGYSLGIALCTDLYAYRRRIWSDVTDPFRRQNRSDLTLMLAAIVFLYFVVLAPAVTFGALLVSNVSTAFSIPLCIFASGACQCLFALCGGQPLLIVGMTGPMLILETCIKLICDVNQAPLGIMRLLVAIYTSVFGCVAVLCNAGWLVLRVRRSLEEVFNFFVSFYFIFKSLKILFTALFHPPVILSTADESHTLSKVQVIHNSINLAMRPAVLPDLFNQNGSWVLSNATEMPGNFEQMQYQQNQARAIGALLLAILMFTVCSSLQAIKRGRYFRRTVRNLFGYFNVPIGLVCAVLVNRFMFAELNADTVQMPPSESFCLAQLIASPFELWWSSGASNLPNPLTNATYHGLAALMAACLLPAIATDAMLSGITVAKSERRLRKPCLFSLDLVISACVMPLISGVLGWPFLSPATVRSNTHVIALTKWNTRTPPGVPHRIIGCVEQRVTGFAIGLLVALSVTLEARLFALVPMGALYGMFLYMGVMGLRDLVLVRRLCVLLKRRKHWKDREYLRHLPPFVMAIFVAIQLSFIGLLLTMNWITEFARIGATSLIFPFILLTYAITREFFLPRWALVRPHLEQMDRLHHLRLPRTRQCGFYRYGAYQSHHLSSDGSNDDDDDFGAVVAGDTSMRDSQGSDERLHHRGPSAVIPAPDELKNPTVFSGIRQSDKSSARINLPWKKSAEQPKVNGCGWTVSSRLDGWSNEDDARQRSISLSACRSWQQFQRKFSDLLTHSILDADTTGRSQGEAAPFVTDEPEHLGLPREEGSPLIMHANHTTKDDDGGNDNEEDEFDLHASSSSLSNIEEYSESELEIRMDNPFWLD